VQPAVVGIRINLGKGGFQMELVNIPVSWGDFVDKVTILEIKKERIMDENSLENVSRELSLLRDKIVIEQNKINQISQLKDSLYEINRMLWGVENSLRQKELRKEFDEEFINLARSVYLNNDKRYLIKRKINIVLHSDLLEEKLYTSDCE
jgi:Family of unknown function (DUF6165)